MKMNKTMGAIMMMAGSICYLGYKYMEEHPSVRKNLKNMAKSATKNIYKKLDEMD